MAAAERFVIGRERNVVRVDFTRQPDPPAPRFPGVGAMRIGAVAECDDQPPVFAYRTREGLLRSAL
jgi:hypothetical protein